MGVALASLDVSGGRDLRIPNSVPYRGSQARWLARLTTTNNNVFDTRVLEEAEVNKNHSKLLHIFESRESYQDRPQRLKETKYLTFKNLGLVATKRKEMVACAY